MLAVLPPYAELHCASNFSFLRGASHPEEQVARAAALGYAALALTDECTLAGAVRAHSAAKEHRAPHELVRWVAENGRLPVVTFTAGGIATPADASLCMQLGADGVFVGSGIFKSGRDPHVDFEGWVEDVSRRARAIVEATTHFDDPKVLAEASTGLGQPMVGISASSLPEDERLEIRGW